MDCCKYGEYRAAHGQYAAWDGYAPYAPPPYAPYAHAYYAPQAHDPYARYYRYDYPAHHVHHAEHAMPLDYGSYASKETRMRRVLARRDARCHPPPQHLQLPPTPPLECGINGRGPPYCDPQMWSHYQMGMMNSVGWNGANALGATWASRGMCARDHMRYPADCRVTKGSHVQNPVCPPEERSTPYPVYDDTPFNGDSSARHGSTPEFSSTGVALTADVRNVHERFYAEPRQTPPEEKRPPVVPLPAFQQAFGSTEIGKFAEAFSRAEVALEEAPGDNYTFETFPEWDGLPEPQWSSQPASREIKCEDNY